jgi:hypothetical protein
VSFFDYRSVSIKIFVWKLKQEGSWQKDVDSDWDYIMNHHQWISAGALTGMGSVHSDGGSTSLSPMDAKSHLL